MGTALARCAGTLVAGSEGLGGDRPGRTESGSRRRVGRGRGVKVHTSNEETTSQYVRNKHLTSAVS
jgi:hypothetical protein